MAGRRTEDYWRDIDRKFSQHEPVADDCSHQSSRPGASSSGRAPASDAQRRLAEVEAEMAELQRAQEAVLMAKQKRDALRAAEAQRDAAAEREQRVERRTQAAENVRGRSEGLRPDFQHHHRKAAVGPHGEAIGRSADRARAEAERWGVSPIWGGGHTQHRERARRQREEAEEAVEVLRERQELYAKDRRELERAKDLYRRGQE